MEGPRATSKKFERPADRAEHADRALKQYIRDFLSGEINERATKIATVDTGEQTDGSLGEVASMPQTPLDITLENEMKRLMREVLSQLKPAEERILRARFGINDGNTMGTETSLEQVARDLNMDIESARKLETLALRKLNGGERRKKTRELLEAYVHSKN